ncbi:G_PROTEIN_RECEP_F1_2 domain-containing protein [Caenorhabditis elegans]|uniref:G_PROTEIN_RECEP_F1_2 domain-containing protein n=1 Tax=Caenorhabditis elegans TaxID=6239 RepID=Q9UAR1_CAEEL|nr:G_PROTEIN_RECEP_F1_2 domain-containing protein [Caenorhabditis elegans]CCD69594.2 G_PROTEIN_RECEP_F1_2 domain-containing protein [Caenorhabditis elegans]|eukprot:NP_503444.4 Serpentine Receptor, class SX [Caenorhabditis elegans]
MQRWNQIFIASHKSIFILLGMFGNIHLIYIILTTSSFRSKASYLQCIQSFAQVFCILNSCIDVYLMLTDSVILRQTCFNITFSTVFCYCVQSTIMFFILLDILILVVFPVAHRNTGTLKYVLIMSTIPFIWGAAVVTIGYQAEENPTLHLCNYFIALQRPLRRVLASATVISNTFSLVVFVILISIFWKKGKTSNESSKTMRHLKFSAIIFIISNYLSVFVINAFILYGYAGDELNGVIGNISIFSMISFTHTFYTIIWRSKDYRKRFFRMYCTAYGPSVTMVVPTALKNTPPSDN